MKTTTLPTIIKRDNKTKVEWNSDKIKIAIQKAAKDANEEINGKFANLLESIENEAVLEGESIEVEKIQEITKRKLMDYGFHRVAEEYIIYANKKSEQRKLRLKPDPTVIADLVTRMRYSRYNKDKKRRESFDECADRVGNMHISRYPQIKDELEIAIQKIKNKEILPSMRSMQFGGKAQELNHAKGYNCSFSICNRVKFFSEAFWLLLSGTGTGFSVQFQHVDELPELQYINESNVHHHQIEDTIEGWASAVDSLLQSYFKTGNYVEFSYHKIRKKGSPLITSGGKAPGHIPLKKAIENVRKKLSIAQGRQLRPIECYDIMCMLADAVYAGGIREAAMICLFSIDDGEMINAKTGDWWKTHPWRARSNNSVVLHRKEVKRRQYNRIFKATKQWGEPGFYFTNDEDTGANPCLTGNMRLLTENGYRTIDELWNDGGCQDYSSEKTLDDYGVHRIINSNGIVIASNVFKTSDACDVYKITLQNGDEIETTDKHKWIVLEDRRKWRENGSGSNSIAVAGRTKIRKLCSDLKIGDKIPLVNHQSFGNFNDESLARAAGWVIGDGSIFTRNDGQQSAILRFWDEDINSCMDVLKDDLMNVYNNHNKSSNQNPQYVGRDGSTDGFNYKRKDIESLVLGRLLKENGLIPGSKHRIPQFIWNSNRLTIAAFLQGIFSADGDSYDNKKKKSVIIKLTQKHKHLLLDIQKLLFMFNIASSVVLEKEGHYAKRPDGTGGFKEYWHDTTYRLLITSVKSCKIFYDEIKFLGKKQETLKSKLIGYDNPQGSYGYTKIKSIEYVGKKATYCLHEPKSNELFINSIQIGNCVEIGLNPKLEITPEAKIWIENWAKNNDKKVPNLKLGKVYWGWQQCNLTEVNCATVKDEDDFYDRVKYATILGTAQAGYTDFKYLGWVSEAICAKEALLGVSLTGMMDKPEIALDPEIQRKAAYKVIEVNNEIANIIGIEPAARTTCVKPSGTASLVVGGVGAGIHAHHARRYFRRIRVNPQCPIYQHFKSINPHMCIHVDENKDLIIFPVEASDNSILKEDMSAVGFLEKVMSTQKNWVIPGTGKPKSSIGLNHNVSNTIVINDEEWDDVREFLWKNKNYFSGVSMLKFVGDKAFQNAPFERISTDSDEALWQELINNYTKINWDDFVELSDETDLSGEVACAGGSCQINI